MKIPERVEEIPGEGLLYELKNRIEWDYSYYISREKSTGGYWKRVSSIAQIPHHAISTYRTHPVEEPDNLFLHKVYTALTETDQQARDEEKESKDSAYRERNMLVCALTKLFPAYLARHDESDESWERDWMWIVYIDLPTGQVSWHIHDSEFTKFSHLEIKENNWDGHNTERKYQRLLALSALSNPPSQV